MISIFCCLRTGGLKFGLAEMQKNVRMKVMGLGLKMNDKYTLITFFKFFRKSLSIKISLNCKIMSYCEFLLSKDVCVCCHHTYMNYIYSIYTHTHTS